jgi:sec-independent protein translocase protein TatB
VIDLGISKLALIGVVALIVIGPEKLPKVARTFGALLGKAQRYVADVKAEVNRSMELDELKKMRTTVEEASRDIKGSLEENAKVFENSWSEATSEIDTGFSSMSSTSSSWADSAMVTFPEYKHPGKKWRLKRGATPVWYKARQGIRTRALSGAARVARFRPSGLSN